MSNLLKPINPQNRRREQAWLSICDAQLNCSMAIMGGSPEEAAYWNKISKQLSDMVVEITERFNTGIAVLIK